MIAIRLPARGLRVGASGRELTRRVEQIEQSLARVAVASHRPH